MSQVFCNYNNNIDYRNEDLHGKFFNFLCQLYYNKSLVLLEN